jgi:hypothetical protein
MDIAGNTAGIKTMKQFTDEELDHLLKCPKKTTTAPKKMMRIEGKHKRNDLKVESVDGLHRFEIFIRQNTEFEENFSVGLIYISSEEARSFTLLRCNGKHGGTNVNPHHAYFHIHRATAQDLNNDINAERSTETTSEYASLPEALAYFFRLIRLNDASDHFPNLGQKPLFSIEATDHESN